MTWITIANQSATFLASQGLNPEYGELTYNDYTYDDPTLTYDYRYDGKIIDRNNWRIKQGPSANWMPEAVTS